jgi:hypothetical protein
MAETPQPRTGPSGLVRITANLTAPCARDLDDLVAATGRNRTDLINRGSSCSPPCSRTWRPAPSP